MPRTATVSGQAQARLISTMKVAASMEVPPSRRSIQLKRNCAEIAARTMARQRQACQALTLASCLLTSSAASFGRQDQAGSTRAERVVSGRPGHLGPPDPARLMGHWGRTGCLSDRCCLGGCARGAYIGDTVRRAGMCPDHEDARCVERLVHATMPLRVAFADPHRSEFVIDRLVKGRVALSRTPSDDRGAEPTRYTASAAG
jgi:hypothetical protein